MCACDDSKITSDCPTTCNGIRGMEGAPAHLTIVCSAMAGPDVRTSTEAVKEARAAPDFRRMCWAQSPVFHSVGSAECCWVSESER